MIQKIIDWFSRLFAGKPHTQKIALAAEPIPGINFNIEQAGSGFKLEHTFYVSKHRYKFQLYLPKREVEALRDKINIALDQTVDFDQPA